ncbi:class I SAM-dependent methyltransferase [Bacillus safensis]|uniref:class I SAM-dependent methyltransferase n=1 Tax=Bacillus safensis TaxID=561879 RepID=UPI001CF07AAF|nr:class I SAM-dependent methyltransferase [Bacillus safensis]MCA6609330.1 class I SAM-dependent methyltransferase [Bacillus safensis]
MSVNQHWHDSVAESYAATIAHKVPGYHLLHELTVDRIEIELTGAASRILTVGAGGGEEIINMLQRNKDWHLTGVDPSPTMLDMAKRRVAQLHMHSLFMKRQGLGKDVFTSFQERLGVTTYPMSEKEMTGQLTEAGFQDIRPYFQAGMIKGIVCKRGHRKAVGK